MIGEGYDVSSSDVFDDSTLAAVNDYKENNGLGNTGAWYGTVGDETWGLLQGEDWQGKVNIDDSVYIDSSGVTITAGNRSGKTVDSSGHLVQNKSSGKKKVTARSSQGSIDALSVAKGLGTVSNVFSMASGFTAYINPQLSLMLAGGAVAIGVLSLAATEYAYSKDLIDKNERTAMEVMTAGGLIGGFVGVFGAKTVWGPSVSVTGGFYGLATELAGAVFP